MSSSSAIDPQPSTEGLINRKQAHPNEFKNEVKADRKSDSKSLEFAHSFPIHKKASPSILSRENTESLSFRGFGNLGCKLLLSRPLMISARNDIREPTSYGGKLRQGKPH
jgi:hypothetical protein